MKVFDYTNKLIFTDTTPGKQFNLQTKIYFPLAMSFWAAKFEC